MSTSVRELVVWNLALLGASFGWFAYIDAPITDAAMLVFCAGAFAGLLSVIAALASNATRTPTRGARLRWAALLSFIAALTLMLIAATATLNLKGTGTDDQGTQSASTAVTSASTSAAAVS